MSALAAGPVVLAFEDVHWVDPTSLELIESLQPLTGSAPLMVLAIFRPNKRTPHGGCTRRAYASTRTAT